MIDMVSVLKEVHIGARSLWYRNNVGPERFKNVEDSANYS